MKIGITVTLDNIDKISGFDGCLFGELFVTVGEL